MMVGGPASASSEATFAAITDMLSGYFAGNLDGLSDRAGEIARTAPSAPASPAEHAERAWALVAVTFAASLDQQFATASNFTASVEASRAEAADASSGDLVLASAFASAFNSLRYGVPLSARAQLEAALATPGLTDDSNWALLARALDGAALSAIGSHGAAIDLLAAAGRDIAARLGAGHPFALLAAIWHAEALLAAQHPDAEGAIEALIDRQGESLQQMPVFSIWLSSLALGFVATDEIDRLTERIFETALAVLPGDHLLFARALESRAYAAFVRGDYRGQLELLVRAAQIYEGVLHPDAPATGESLMNLAMAAANLHAPAEALQWSDLSLRIARAGTGTTSSVTGVRMVEAGTVRSLAGQPEAALSLIREARRIFAALDSADMPRIAEVFVPLQEAKALMAAGRPSEAAAIHAELLKAIAGRHLAGTLVDFNVEADHALALRHAGQPAAALVSARRALKGLLEYRDADGSLSGGPASGKALAHPLRLSAETVVHSAWRQAEATR
jgi:hypothetical protein